MTKSLIFALLFGLCACAQKSVPSGFRGIASLQNPADVEGIWDLQGSNVTRGPYTGQLELRRSSDGTFSVVRIINYISYYYQGLRVQEVWTGKAVPNKQNLVVTYDLKAADFITDYESTKRFPEDFKRTTSINEFFNPTEKNTLESHFSDNTGSTYQEWIMSKKDLEDKPLWADQRVNMDARSTAAPSSALRNEIKSAKLKSGFEKEEIVKSYAHRAEFKNEQPFVVFDPTDYDFYQSDNEVLRVVNKTIDNISLMESLLRRNAYALTLAQKQKGFERNLQDKHLDAQGLVIPSQISDQSKDEGAISLTGIYIASQAMRFLKTKSSEALQNILKSLKGLQLSANSVKEEQDFVGIVQGLVWASVVVPAEDQATWKVMRETAKSLLEIDLLKSNNQNRALAYGMAAYLLQDEALKSEYRNFYSTSKKNSVSAFYWAGSANWQRAYSQVQSDVVQIILAELLQETSIRDQLREDLMSEWSVYAPAQRPLITLSSYAFAYRYGVRGDRFRNLSSEAQFQKSLQLAAWGLKEIPFPRVSSELSYDHSLSPSWCVSPIPADFWEINKKEKASVQGLYSYPAFESGGIDSRFIWNESAFKYKGTVAKGQDLSGVDYLYAYWLARYAGVIDEKN